MTCCGPACGATARHFTSAVARSELDRYRRHGPDKRARLLVDGLIRAGIDGSSILDVGAGVGLLTFELLKRGAAGAVLADASPAQLDVAREEAVRLAMADRVRVVHGDFVDTGADLDPADIVVLDRTVCCYPAWRPLLEAAADHCRRLLGLTYPRQRLDIRLALAVESLRRRLSGDAFRAFVHPPAAMDAALRECGFRRISHAGTWAWNVDLYQRTTGEVSTVR